MGDWLLPRPISRKISSRTNVKCRRMGTPISRIEPTEPGLTAWGVVRSSAKKVDLEFIVAQQSARPMSSSVRKHEHLTASTALEQPVRFRHLIEPESAGNLAHHSRAIFGQRQPLADELRKFVEALHPPHAVVLGNED